MTLDPKTALALISFLAIGTLVYPVVSKKQSVQFELNRFNSGQGSALSTPLDWRSLISDEKRPTN